MFENIKKQIKEKLKIINNNEIETFVYNSFFDTIDNCLTYNNKNVYIKTGDIPAMWLRDSVCQVMQYTYFLDNKELQNLIFDLLNTLYNLIIYDPYANAFNKDERVVSIWKNDKTNIIKPLVWERKFEIDSLIYPLFLTIKYFNKTNDYSIFNDSFYKALDTILEVLEKEMDHYNQSDYYFLRKGKPKESIKENKKNVKDDNLLCWSGFRASDDLASLHYNIPENMFIVSTLFSLNKIINSSYNKKIEYIIDSIKKGIEKYGIYNHKKHGLIYIYETNKTNKKLLIDDANIPSLLSIPYINYPFMDNNIYLNTKKYILSRKNKYFYKGKIVSGIGSMHTKKNYVWPLSLIMEGLVENNKERKKEIIKNIIEISTNSIHESVNKNNKTKYTREHFGWANSLFAELAISNLDLLKEIYD